MKKLLSILCAVIIVISSMIVTGVPVEATTGADSISIPNTVKLGLNEFYWLPISKANKNQTVYGFDWVLNSPSNHCYTICNRRVTSSKSSVGYGIRGTKVGHDYFWAATHSFNAGWNSYDAMSTIYVYNAPSSVKINCNKPKLGVGEKITISESTNSGSYANAQNINWSVSNSNGSVSKGSDNKATVQGKKNGTFKTTVSTYNGKKGSEFFTVYNAPSSISIGSSDGGVIFSNWDYFQLSKGNTFTVFEFTNSGSYANPDNIQWWIDKEFWSTSGVATVSKVSGTNKAIIKANKVGTCWLKVKTYNGKVAQLKIKVVN